MTFEPGDMVWNTFATAPRDRDIFASGSRAPNGFHKATYGQRFRWSEEHQDWRQCVAGRWYRPFFTPTRWAEIPASGERPEPMFDTTTRN